MILFIFLLSFIWGAVKDDGFFGFVLFCIYFMIVFYFVLVYIEIIWVCYIYYDIRMIWFYVVCIILSFL